MFILCTSVIFPFYFIAWPRCLAWQVWKHLIQSGTFVMDLILLQLISWLVLSHLTLVWLLLHNSAVIPLGVIGELISRLFLASMICLVMV